MIEYWLQNGETFHAKDIKSSLELIFQNDGKFTQVSQAFFKQLNARNLDDLAKRVQNSLSDAKKWKGKEKCSICDKPNTAKMKQWIYPFIIAKEKFPNIHPNGKVDTLYICSKCALKSIRAYGRIKFNGQRDYLSFVLFFSTSAAELKEFYQTQQEHPTPGFYRNWADKPPDIIYYPYEFLVYILYNIASKQAEYGDIGLGALVFGLSTGSKKIFDTADIVDNLNPIIVALRRFSGSHLGESRSDSQGRSYDFTFLFKRLRKGGQDVDPGMFIDRNLFFKSILKEKKIDWYILEDILFYNVANDRNIPFIKPFLLTLMEELHMAEKEIFEQVSSEGYRIGISLLDAEKDRDKAKRYLYELRRKRRMEEFLDAINLIQLEAEKNLDDRPFKEHPELFHKLKVFFLIGMANAIFSRGKEEVKSDEG